MKPAGPGQSAQLLAEVALLLDSLEIPYAVIGGLAASFHGIVRSSLDADAIISARDEGQLDELIRGLQRKQLHVSHRKGDFDDPIDSVVVVTDEHFNKVDLLTGIRGLSPDFASRTVEASLFGQALLIVGLEDFIAMKVFAGAPRDIHDARAALQVSSENVDMALLLQLARQYGQEAGHALEGLLEEEDL